MQEMTPSLTHTKEFDVHLYQDPGDGSCACGINYTIVILHALIEYWKDPFKVNLPGIWWPALINYPALGMDKPFLLSFFLLLATAFSQLKWTPGYGLKEHWETKACVCANMLLALTFQRKCANSDIEESIQSYTGPGLLPLFKYTSMGEDLILLILCSTT